uniref:Uncharacterized protein n=1 Tax=Myotis myotis TaxID=51298 RepID=A0A7J7Y0J5_MYOMY|nr:hypothetical protein mMyoMyo1_011386 [Myotis myotis]
MSSIQGTSSSVPEPPESSRPTSDNKLQELIEALKAPPETLMTVLYQIIEFLRNNEKEIKELREGVDDIKRRISQLNLSSCVSMHPPEGHIDLTPCLEPQAIAPAPPPPKSPMSKEPEPNSAEAKPSVVVNYKNMKMSTNKFPEVSPEDTIIPGYTSLILQIALKYSQYYIRIALASTYSEVLLAPITAYLTVDLEPTGLFSTCLYFRWSDTAYSILQAKLVAPQTLPQQGKISLPPDIGRQVFKAQFEIESYCLDIVEPGSLVLSV